MEPLFTTRQESAPDPQNIFDCGSVIISINDCFDLIRSVSSLDHGETLPLYSKVFRSGEMGRVTFTSLHLRSHEDTQEAVLEAAIRHTHPVKIPHVFSTDFVQQLTRRQQLKGGDITSIASTSLTEETMLKTTYGTITLRTVKGKTVGDKPDKASRRSSLVISAPLPVDSDPQTVRTLLKTWGDAVDILTTFPLAKRRVIDSPSLDIQLQRLFVDEAMLGTFVQLEQYAEAARAAGMSLPLIEYDQLDVAKVQRVTDEDILAATLAARALTARRVYGKTGIMPNLTTQSLVDTAQTIRATSEQ